VNGRPIASRPLAQAVRVAFGDALPRTRFPVGAVHLEIDPAVIDVNVHPTKREIRFSRERELCDAVRLRVREALLATPLSSDAAGSAPGYTSNDRDVPARGPSGPDGLSAAERSVGQRTLDVPATAPEISAPTVTGRAGRFTLLGVLDALYWVAATEDGLVLVDQHAASERLLFETLRRTGSLARQALVDPVTVVLSGAQRAAWEAHAESVRSAGFELDAFGPALVRVRAVPSYRARFPRPESIREMLDELSEGGRPTLPDDLVARTAATIACHAAIRAGDAVGADEVARLVTALDRLPERVRTCPHGRPIFVRVPRSRLDRWFLRSGP
jgi:DNA mismatch repair protein MutL